MTPEEFQKDAWEKVELLKTCHEELHQRKLKVFEQEKYIQKIMNDLHYLLNEAKNLNKIV